MLIAKITIETELLKIVGYRMLMRYEGMDQEEDDKYDFWVNIGSDEVKNVGYW